MARLGAGTRRKASGILEKRITINGKRFSIYGHNSKEIAEKESEIRESIKAGLYIENRNVTLDQYFKKWIDRRNKTKANKPATLDLYGRLYRLYISPHLGNRKIQKLERREILEYRETLQDLGLAANSINLIITLLKEVLKDAIGDEITNRNPAANIRQLLNEAPAAAATIHRALTIEETTAFLEAAKDNYYYELFLFLLCTGMRIGEAGALEWKDIDYKKQVIHITKTVTNGGEIGSPKTKSSLRDIPLTETAKAVLKQQREKQSENVIPMPHTRIFNNIHGGICHHSGINTILKKLTAQANIDYFSIHALRDTFATRFIEQGGTPQTLKTILGHSSITITMDLYAHVLPNTKADEMGKIHFFSAI